VKLSKFDLDHVNYWNISTESVDDVVTDFVILNYGEHNILLKLKFPRFKALVYHESFLDYALSFSKSLQFIELRNQLRDELPYLMNIYSLEPEDVYG
jgi:hypothetical protein